MIRIVHDSFGNYCARQNTQALPIMNGVLLQ